MKNEIKDCCIAILIFYDVSKYEYDKFNTFSTISGEKLNKAFMVYNIVGLLDFAKKYLNYDINRNILRDRNMLFEKIFKLLEDLNITRNVYDEILKDFCLDNDYSYNVIMSNIGVEKFKL